jgi:hypothetical protein
MYKVVMVAMVIMAALCLVAGYGVGRVQGYPVEGVMIAVCGVILSAVYFVMARRKDRGLVAPVSTASMLWTFGFTLVVASAVFYLGLYSHG